LFPEPFLLFILPHIYSPPNWGCWVWENSPEGRKPQFFGPHWFLSLVQKGILAETPDKILLSKQHSTLCEWSEGVRMRHEGWFNIRVIMLTKQGREFCHTS
jgi:hypothetical protein